MKNSKLVRILRRLTKKELGEFKKFVHSPFFNTKKKCIDLYDLLLLYAPKFSSEEINSSEFTGKIYKNKRSFETVQERLLRLLERFLAQRQFEKNEAFYKYFLLEELREKREQQHYALLYKQTQKKTTEKRQNNAALYGEYLIEASQAEMLYQQRASQEKKAEQLKRTIESFNKHLLSNHLALDNAVLNALELGSDVVKEIITKEIVQDSKIFVNFASREIYSQTSLIKLRLLLRQLLIRKEENIFRELFDTLKKEHSFIGVDDKQNFYKFLANYCIDQIHLGNEDYYKELLNLYIFAMEIDALLEGKYLTPFRLKNIIIVSVKIAPAKSKQFKFADGLLKKYLPSVDPQYCHVTEAYCHGYLHFHQKEYGKAEDLLNQCIDMKSLFGIDAQSIVYKIYYETNKNWAFNEPIEAFITRLFRKMDKYPKEIIQGHINFFRILKAIYKQKTNPNKKSFDKIRERLHRMKYLSDKQWLLQKIKKLEG